MSKAVKAVASIAVGVTVGFATGNPMFGFAAGAAVFGASESLSKPKVGGGTASQAELKQVIRSSKEPAHFQFGPFAKAGLMSWAQEEAGDQTKRERLFQIYVLHEGEIEAVDEFYLDQTPIADAGEKASYKLFRSPSQPDQFMLDNSPDWRRSQIGRGLSFVRLMLRYDADYYSSGIPTPLIVGRGERNIYDPRTGQTGYSDNAALVILWYVRTRLKWPDDEIMWDTFESAANICAESVRTADGSYEPRYSIGGGFKADTRKDQPLNDMVDACAGQILRIGGKLGLMVGAYYGPYDFTITEDMVIGAVSGQTEVSQSDAVNTIRGKFIDPNQRWTETDYPAVTVDEWVQQDGGPIEDKLDLKYVFRPHHAQRLAHIRLRRKRAGGTLSIPLNFRGYACRPGRVVRVHLPTLNIDGEFRVESWDFHGDNGCKVELSIEDPKIYDDAVGKPYGGGGFISMPTGGVAAPSGLTYTLESIGEIVQGRLDWSAVSGAVHYNVVIKHAGKSVQAMQVPPDTTTCVVGGLPSGQYVAEVRTRGAFGQSGAATATFSVNAPPMPEDVLVQVTNTEVTLIPRLKWSGTPVSFRFYYSPTPLPPNDVRAGAQLLSTGASLVHVGRSFGTTYYYWVESVNAYGHSDLYAIEATTSQKFDEWFAVMQENIEQKGLLYDAVVKGLEPAAIDAASEAVKPFRDDLDANTDSIGEMQMSLEEIAFKLLLLKASGEVSASTLRVEQTVRADLARLVTTLQTGQARVEDDLYTIYDPETEGFTAAAIRTVDVGGRKAVLGMQSNGEMSEIGAIADRFYVYNEVSGESVLAFVIEDGRVVMPEAMIGKINVKKLVTDTGETLIEGGKIKTKFIDADSLMIKEIVSKVSGFGGRPTYAFYEGGSWELNAADNRGGMRWRGPTQTVVDEKDRMRVRMGVW